MGWFVSTGNRNGAAESRLAEKLTGFGLKIVRQAQPRRHIKGISQSSELLSTKHLWTRNFRLLCAHKQRLKAYHDGKTPYLSLSCPSISDKP